MPEYERNQARTQSHNNPASSLRNCSYRDRMFHRSIFNPRAMNQNHTFICYFIVIAHQENLSCGFCPYANTHLNHIDRLCLAYLWALISHQGHLNTPPSQFLRLKHLYPSPSWASISVSTALLYSHFQPWCGIVATVFASGENGMFIYIIPWPNSEM